MRKKWINLLLYSFRQILPSTIRGKMMLWLIVLSLAPVLAVGITAYQNSRAALEREIINKLNAVADNKVSILKGWLQTNLSDVQRLAANRASKDLLSPAFRSRFPDQSAKTGEERIQNSRSLLTALQETNPSYADVLIADKDGKVVLSSSSAASKEGKDLGAIGLPKLDMFQPSTSSVYRSPISMQQVFALSSPIHDHEANVVGLAILEVELVRVQDLIGERSGLGETGEVIIVDRDRRMLTQSRLSKESTVLKTIPEGNSVRQGLEGKKGEEFEKDYRGISVVSSYRPVFELGAALIAKIDESEGFSPVTRLRNTVIAIIILTILAASGASWVIARVISQPIHEGVRFARQIAEGDLTANLPTEDKSRTSQLAIALNQMAEDLRQMVSRITEVVQSTNAAAAGISAAVEEQERTIAFQAVSINEISATVNELAQSSNQVGKTAEEVSGQWREVLQATEEGNRSVQKAAEEMNLIKGMASGISQNILKLSEQIQKISSIVQTVANIAEQTNMLALNAGIEAARAGEHGKGFAVVATEVRKLADQSQKAADQIGAIIQEIQAATHSTILAVEEGTKGVESGVQQVLQAGDTIQTVTSTIRKTVDAVQEISLATRQQAIGVDQVSEAMRSIDQGMKETVSGTKQVNVSASQLVTLGRSLQELVKKFQVAKEDRLNQRHGDPD